MPPQKPLQTQNNTDIARLVRRGLLPAKDLPLLKAAMISQQKKGDIAKLTKPHRDVLQRYNSALSGAAYGSRQSVSALVRNIGENYEITRDEFISERVAVATDPPMMLILKRKGIRIFPDGKRVALYTNERLGLSFTIPYNSNSAEQEIIGVQAEENEIMESLEQVAAYAQQEEPKATAKHMKFADGSKLKVSHGAAKAIHMVHGALSDENKKKFADMLSNPKGFEKAAHFALSKVNFSINK
jgi:hypothetical protein